MQDRGQLVIPLRVVKRDDNNYEIKCDEHTLKKPKNKDTGEPEPCSIVFTNVTDDEVASDPEAPGIAIQITNPITIAAFEHPEVIWKDYGNQPKKLKPKESITLDVRDHIGIGPTKFSWPIWFTRMLDNAKDDPPAAQPDQWSYSGPDDTEDEMDC